MSNGESEGVKDEIFQTARQKIAEAVTRARASGVEVGHGRFGVGVGASSKYVRNQFPACCPIGCLLLDEPSETYLLADAAKLLDVSQFAIYQFIRGFDGCGFQFSNPEVQAGRVPYDREFYDLGIEYRIELALEKFASRHKI